MPEDQKGIAKKQPYTLLDAYAYGGNVYPQGSDTYPDGLREFIEANHPHHLSGFAPKSPSKAPVGNPVPVQPQADETDESDLANGDENDGDKEDAEKDANSPADEKKGEGEGETGQPDKTPLPQGFPAIRALKQAGVSTWEDLLAHENVGSIEGVNANQLEQIARLIRERG